jgi:hypothetical protein
MLQPARDLFSALDSCLHGSPVRDFSIILSSLLLSWWVYVPLHELLHALGCVLGGGSVSRLELSPLYGAALLGKFFSFLYVGSEYAGQLKGFDTFGSDLTYFLTVFFPFFLTVIIGLPLLKSVSSASHSSPFCSCMKFGIAIPFAYAPFLSMTGDYYEMGSILISQFAALLSGGPLPLYWRSDDMIHLLRTLFLSGRTARMGDMAGVSASFLLGIVLIYVTYWAGILFSRIAKGLPKKSPS